MKNTSLCDFGLAISDDIYDQTYEEMMQHPLVNLDDSDPEKRKYLSICNYYRMIFEGSGHKNMNEHIEWSITALRGLGKMRAY